MKAKIVIISHSTTMVSMTFSVELKKKNQILKIRIVGRPLRWGAGFIHESNCGLHKYLPQIKLY